MLQYTAQKLSAHLEVLLVLIHLAGTSGQSGSSLKLNSVAPAQACTRHDLTHTGCDVHNTRKFPMNGLRAPCNPLPWATGMHDI